jgi:hypothetical protein
MRVQEVLLVMMRHPLREDRSAARDDSGDTLGHQRNVFDQHARVDRHIIDALLRLLLDHLEHQLGREVFQTTHSRHRFVNRHCPDWHRRIPQNRLANLWNIAAR